METVQCFHLLAVYGWSVNNYVTDLRVGGGEEGDEMPLNLSSSGQQHADSLFAKAEQKKKLASDTVYTCAKHARFAHPHDITHRLPGTKWPCSWPCFNDF